MEPLMSEGSGVFQSRSPERDFRNLFRVHVGVHQFLQQHSGVHVLIRTGRFDIPVDTDELY